MRFLFALTHEYPNKHYSMSEENLSHHTVAREPDDRCDGHSCSMLKSKVHLLFLVGRAY